MRVIEIAFACGTKTTACTLLSRLSEYGVGASNRTLEIAQRVVRRNHELAEAVLDEPIFLIQPTIVINQSGSHEVPPYWCAVELQSAWSVEQEVEQCFVQWYQDDLNPKFEGTLMQWAAGLTWKEAVNASLRRDA
jgi:hypothetical protein